jgi:hypothetical protein
VLLSLDGFEFEVARGYLVKIEARQVEATHSRPHGVKYSPTLHDEPGGSTASTTRTGRGAAR